MVIGCGIEVKSMWLEVGEQQKDLAKAEASEKIDAERAEDRLRVGARLGEDASKDYGNDKDVERQREKCIDDGGGTARVGKVNSVLNDRRSRQHQGNDKQRAPHADRVH